MGHIIGTGWTARVRGYETNSRAQRNRLPRYLVALLIWPPEQERSPLSVLRHPITERIISLFIRLSISWLNKFTINDLEAERERPAQITKRTPASDKPRIAKRNGTQRSCGVLGTLPSGGEITSAELRKLAYNVCPLAEKP
jgi:hypothetical protein